MKKVVLKVDFYDDRTKQKAMKIVSGILGVESVSADMKENKLSLIGDVDPVNVAGKLRKCCKAEMVYVGPAKEDNKPKMDSTNVSSYPLPIYEPHPLYYQMTPSHYNQQYYYVGSVEEDPKGCVIC